MGSEPFPAAKKSLVSKVEARYQPIPLKRADRVPYHPTSKPIVDVTKMIKELDVKCPFKTNGEISFPRKDYTPYVTYVDCRDNNSPSSRLGLPSSSNDGDDQ